MAKPRTPNQKKRYAALNKRLTKYVALVQSIYDSLNLEAASIVTSMTDYSADSEQPFRFGDYPQTRSRVNDLMRFFSHDIQALIYAGTTEEWKQSNLVQDLLANDVLKVYGMRRGDERVKRYYQPNNDALKAFQKRKDKGFTVSQKVWNQSYNFRRELEYAISSGIEKGQSAVTLSKRISKYLHDFPSLQADYKERYGEATDCKDCEYRSIRLARSEINMAYRTAEQTRWQQMDFIKGYEIKLSHSHPKKDVCDELAGVYPKWFKWTGWHPNCYSDDSKVLTNSGWKLFKDVCKDDLILSLNPTNKDVEWVGIKAIQCHRHNGDMVHFYNKSLDCLVTPEHQIVYLNKGDGSIKRCPALEYRKGKGGFYRGCEYDAPDIKKIFINGKKYDFDVFCEFMAYYLSDGSTQRNSGICIAQKDGQPFKQDIMDCIKHLGYKPSNYGDAIYFFDCKFNSYLKQFGGARDKYVPDEIKQASKRQIKIFLDAYTKCDGYTRRRNEARFIGSHGADFVQKREERLYFSASDLMVRDLSELILKVGHRPSFRKGDVGVSHTSEGRVIKSNYPCWTISECYSTTATVFDKKIVPYDGFVYDLTLERNHIMYIRRNGKCFWGSNCMDYCVPIVMTDDEMYSGKGQVIEDFPDNFVQWARENRDRIEQGIEKGTAPYWVQDNLEKVMESSRAYEMTEEDARELAERGFDVNFRKYNDSEMRGFDLLKFDKDVEIILDVNGIRIEDCSISRDQDDGSMVLYYFGTSEAGGQFEMRRKFFERNGKIVVKHDLLEIPEELQDKGIARMLFRPMLQQYLAMGADEIELVANMDIGGYAWARYGFSTRNFYKAYDMLAFSEASNEVQELARKYLESYYSAIPKETPFPMRLLAAQPYGKELLLNTFWDGYMNLKDRKQVAYIKHYIGL